MGNDLSLSACVELRDLPAAIYAELTSEDYTVIRTNGSKQSGWRIPTGAHRCASGAACAEWAGALATNRVMPGGKVCILGDSARPWRVHMVFDGEDSEESAKHACGWRVSEPERRTFWPTRLSGTSAETTAAREAWWLRLDELLNSLESYEQKEANKVKAAELKAAELKAAKLKAAANEDSDEEEFQKAQAGDWKIPKGFSGVDEGKRLEAAYAADEPARQAAAKALLEDPVASTGMMILMRQRESTMARCKRNGALAAIPAGKNFGSLLMDLQAVSEHDSNRVRRLFDSGCPKAIIIHLCQILVSAPLRNQFITEEEAKLYLEPLAQPVRY
jgi:hypothetical protein